MRGLFDVATCSVFSVFANHYAVFVLVVSDDLARRVGGHGFIGFCFVLFKLEGRERFRDGRGASAKRDDDM